MSYTGKPLKLAEVSVIIDSLISRHGGELYFCIQTWVPGSDIEVLAGPEFITEKIIGPLGDSRNVVVVRPLAT